MAGKNTAVFGIYRDQLGVENGVDALKSAGFRNTDISVLFPDNQGSKDFAHKKDTKAPEGAATGAGTGAVVGGTLGWLVGIGALAIPGLGPFIAAGPIVAALAGVGVGGTVGGLAGALIGMGIPEYEAKRYEGRVKDGGILLSVHSDSSEWTSRAKEILKSTGAADIASSGEAKADYDKSEKPLPRSRRDTMVVETSERIAGSDVNAISTRRDDLSVDAGSAEQISTPREAMADTDDVIDRLEDLIETCRDGEDGYRQAADNVKDPELADFFRRQSSQRGQFAQELQAEVQRLGKTDPEREGSVSGTMHRTWLDLKQKMGAGDKSILESVERGEDSAKDAYQDALADEGLGANVIAIVHRQAESIFAAHDRVKALRDSLKAA